MVAGVQLDFCLLVAGIGGNALRQGAGNDGFVTIEAGGGMAGSRYRCSPIHFGRRGDYARRMEHGVFERTPVSESRPGIPWVVRMLGASYLMMTTFMLQGVRVSVMGRVCAPRLVLVGGAQVLVPAGSGGVPVGEPDRS